MIKCLKALIALPVPIVVKQLLPFFYNRDIERLAKHFRIKPGEFIDKHLRIDEDKDYVLKQAPCPFLGSDNYCSVYEARPTACREYPHTDRKTYGANFRFDI